MLTLIAAIDEKRTLGADNNLIWSLPDDMKHFVQCTKGHAVIMGRKTFESINSKPLPKRHNVVITRQDDFSSPYESVSIVNSLEEALELVKDDDQPFCVGGAQIYKLALPHAKRLEITHIHHSFEGGDAYFPEIDKSVWEVVNEEYHSKDERHAQDFTITRYERKD